MSQAPRKALAISLALGLALGSCAEPPKVTVFNNSGRQLTLKLGNDYFFEPTRTRIPAGRSKTLFWGRMAERGMVVLEVDGCSYAFDPPRLDRAYFQAVNDYNPSTNVQVDADLTVVLLPVTATQVMPNAKELPLQAQYGFPLKPVSTSCEAGEP